MTERELKNIFRQHGIRYTMQRAEVYRLLARHRQAMTAGQVQQALAEEAAKEGKEGLWLSTVYRVLDCFVAAKLCLADHVPGLEGLSYRLLSEEDQHHAVCLSCHRLIELAECPVHEVPQELESLGFDCTGHKVEFYGYCSDCQDDEVKKGRR